MSTIAEAPPPEPDALARIVEMREKVRVKGLTLVVAKEALKEAKAEYDGQVAELMVVIDEIRNGQKPLPLFDRPAEVAEAPAAEDDDKPSTLPPAPAALGDQWKAKSLADLQPYGLTDNLLENLNDADLFTLGQLADWTSGGRELTDIGGIGPAKAGRIADALGRFWKENTPEAATSDEGDDE